MTKRFGGTEKEFVRINPLAMPEHLPHVVTFTNALLDDVEVVVYNTKTHTLVTRAWLNEESEQMYARARIAILKEQANIKELEVKDKTAQVEAQTKFINALGQLAASVANVYDCGPRQS